MTTLARCGSGRPSMTAWISSAVERLALEQGVRQAHRAGRGARGAPCARPRAARRRCGVISSSIATAVVLRVVLVPLREVAAEEDRLFSLAVGERAELLAHAQLAHHRASDLRGAADVVGGAGGDLAEDDLFRDAAAERHGDARREPARASSRWRSSIGQELRDAERRAARDDA